MIALLALAVGYFVAGSVVAALFARSRKWDTSDPDAVSRMRLLVIQWPWALATFAAVRMGRR